MIPWANMIALLACAFGGGLGLWAMINPAWASRLVRLKADADKVEGRSEFRATYGGLFLFGHAFAAWALLSSQSGAELAAAGIGAGWAGAATGRLLSFALDHTATRINIINVAVEAGIALALVMPLLVSLS